MKPRKFSLRSLVGRFLGKRSAQSATLAPAPPKRASARERVRSEIEPLEGRIAPAILLNPHTLIYTDTDGDAVKVTFSRDLYDAGTVLSQSTIDNIFIFSAGHAHIGDPNATDDVPQQLRLINLSSVPAKLVNGRSISRVAGISLAVAADAVSTGDGLTAIGAIQAGSNALGIVRIDGDLGQIDAGTGAARIGLLRLDVQSIGKFGITSQSPLLAPDLNSQITGRLGQLVVAGDMQGYIHVVDATTTAGVTQRGTIGLAVIRGSLIGSGVAGAGSDNTGRIDASYDIGRVFIGSDSTDGIFGGAGKNSGALTAGRNIGSVAISGGISGGTTDGAGTIVAGRSIGPVRMSGALEGGGGLNSGSIRSSGTIGDVTIGSGSAPASITGGAGESSGLISSGAALGNVHVFGNIVGTGPHSGRVFSTGNIASVAIEGSLTGGASPGSGTIESLSNLGSVFVGGNVQGGDGPGSGSIIAERGLARIVIDGNLAGGKGANSGSILGGHDPSMAARTLGSVSLQGAMLGGEGNGSGSIVSGGTMASVRVGSSLQSGVAVQGGVGALSGTIFSDGSIASVGIYRGVEGGVGAGSGSIQSLGLLRNIVILGDLAGGSGAESGSILSHEIASVARPVPGDIGSVRVIGNLVGAGDRTAMIQADGILGRAIVGGIQGGPGSYSAAIVSGSGYVRTGATAFIAVAGAVEGGAGDHSGSITIGGRLGGFSSSGLALADIRVQDDIGVLRVSGDIVDSSITARGAVARSSTADIAIGLARIVGNVTHSSILAGYDVTGAAVNASAQIGVVGVTGNWTSSVLAAGVLAGTDSQFGNDDDRLMPGAHSGRIISAIARVVVVGAVEGTPGSGDHFGFVAERIGSFSSGGTALPLRAPGGQTFEMGTNSDVTVREVVFV